MYYDYYDMMVDDLADEMLDKIAEEIAYEDGMEVTAGLTDSIKKAFRTAGATPRQRGFAKARRGLRAAGAGIGQMVTGKSPQNRFQKMLGKIGPMGGVAIGGVGGLGVGHAYRNRIGNNAQEKAADYFEEAEIYKEAAEDAWMEAQAMEDLAIEIYNSIYDDDDYYDFY